MRVHAAGTAWLGAQLVAHGGADERADSSSHIAADRLAHGTTDADADNFAVELRSGNSRVELVDDCDRVPNDRGENVSEGCHRQ